MKSVKYLEMVKERKSIKSDRQLALVLKKGQNTISQYMNGQRVMDDETCLAVAIELCIDPMEVVGAACMDRAAKVGQSSLWENFLKARMAAAVTLAVISVNLFLTPDEAKAAQLLAQQAKAPAEHFVLCQIKFAGNSSATGNVASVCTNLFPKVA